MRMINSLLVYLVPPATAVFGTLTLTLALRRGSSQWQSPSLGSLSRYTVSRYPVCPGTRCALVPGVPQHPLCPGTRCAPVPAVARYPLRPGARCTDLVPVVLDVEVEVRPQVDLVAVRQQPALLQVPDEAANRDVICQSKSHLSKSVCQSNISLSVKCSNHCKGDASLVMEEDLQGKKWQNLGHCQEYLFKEIFDRKRLSTAHTAKSDKSAVLAASSTVP